jgi:hypothetical protein
MEDVFAMTNGVIFTATAPSFIQIIFIDIEPLFLEEIVGNSSIYTMSLLLNSINSVWSLNGLSTKINLSSS